MDRLRAIRYFIKVAETQNFTLAAKALGVPASSVSRRIQDLEADMGISLLTRTTRVVKLTELGEIYLEQVRGAVAGLDAAESVVRDRPGAPTGLLRITCTPSYGSFCLMPVLRKMRTKFPDLVVDLELTDQVSNLASDDVDLAIRATADPPERAIARKLTDNRFTLVAAPNYLEHFGNPKILADLDQHRTLLYRGPQRIIHWQAKLIAGGWKEVMTHPSFICNAGAEMVAEAEAGMGLALLPRWGIEQQLATGALKPLSLEDAELAPSRNDQSGIYLLYHQPKYRLNKIKTSVDFLLTHLAK
ncbi:nitrogen assimilation regulatory protein nac [Maritalea myrionectae]|uniref:Nitrogen assimilation regulatory protein nac n=1 Tax=Maritalea myrionectae TaxID=454601 RepID=A0A2R4MA85_9HYPH|nr:LysR family transcriptional regulator [Maritalea myrionectae]AVX02779.1 nitrogen assimilation regulatory protein nac [Maritalea myrionectae]